MKELNKILIGKKSGYKLTQIFKTDEGYIYECENNEEEYKDVKPHYEIFKRKINSRFNCVSYPSDKAFGDWAFTTMSINHAKSILKSFLNIKYEVNSVAN